MALIDQLGTFKGSLDSIKTALSNKGVGVSKLTADLISSNIAKINTNQTNTKNMGTKSVTFKEDLIALEIRFSWKRMFTTSGSQYTGFDGISKIVDAKGNPITYSKSSQGNLDLWYSSKSSQIAAYSEYLSSGSWPTAGRSPTPSGYARQTKGVKIKANVPAGVYNIYCNSYTGQGQTTKEEMCANISVSKTNYTFDLGVY